jgi:hypothetical protein
MSAAPGASRPASSATITWRPSGPPLLLRLVPLAAVAWYAVSGLLRLLDPGRPEGSGDTLLLLGNLLLLVAAAAAALVTGRTRVRVDDTGVEVRETGTRLYRWEEITGARPDVPGRPRVVVLELVGGRRRVLPVPSGSMRRAGDRTIPDAVALLRHRLNDG